MSSIRNYLNEAKTLSRDGILTLTVEDGADVWHITDDYYEDALSDIGLPEKVAELLTHTHLKIQAEYTGDVLESLRDCDLLEDYPRDHSGFSDFIASAIRENLYECEFIDRSTEKYDHKRGFANFSSSFTMNIDDALACSDSYLNTPEHHQCSS